MREVSWVKALTLYLLEKSPYLILEKIFKEGIFIGYIYFPFFLGGGEVGWGWTVILLLHLCIAFFPDLPTHFWGKGFWKISYGLTIFLLLVLKARSHQVKGNVKVRLRQSIWIDWGYITFCSWFSHPGEKATYIEDTYTNV